ncbi:MAG TPA: hypothetical protein VI322_02600 [Candidatus Saccharimonadia bacterium]
MSKKASSQQPRKRRRPAGQTARRPGRSASAGRWVLPSASALPTHAEVVAQLHELNEAELGGVLPVAEIVDSIFGLMQRPKGHIELIERWVPLAPDHAEELIGLLFTLWNVTPQPDEGGKTLLETLAEEHAAAQRSVASEANAVIHHDPGEGWAAAVPLLEGIKQIFQEQFFPAYEALPKRVRGRVLDGLPILFFRYWHTACPELEDWPPMLALEHQREHGLEISLGQHIMMRMYRNPDLPDDPKYNVRTTYGLEDDDFLPLSRQHARAAEDYDAQQFWTDPQYRQWLKELGELKLEGSSAFEVDQQVLQWVFERGLMDWLRTDAYIKGKFTHQAWYEFWRATLQRPVGEPDENGNGWWSLDEIYARLDAQASLRGSELSDAFAAAQDGDPATLGRLRVELGEKRFGKLLQDFYFFSCNLFEYLLVPLGLYLPVIQPLWQEPMDVAEEVEEFRSQSGPAARVVAKPPALLRPTPYGAQLLAGLAEGLEFFDTSSRLA